MEKQKIRKRIVRTLRACAMVVGLLAATWTPIYAAGKASITLNKSSVILNVGKTTTLNVKKVKNLKTKKCTFISKNKKIVQVSTSKATNKCTIKGIKAGTTYLTVTAKEDARIKKKIKITVKQPVKKLTMSKKLLSLKTGSAAQLKVTVSLSATSNKSVAWSSRNAKVAKVSSKGKVSGVGRGTTYIIATAKDGSGKIASCKITVTQLVTEIKLSSSALQMTGGDTSKLTATVSPGNANNGSVTWISTNSNVVTVDSVGKLTAKASGTVK